jgi:hypothetical protein
MVCTYGSIDARRSGWTCRNPPDGNFPPSVPATGRQSKLIVNPPRLLIAFKARLSLTEAPGFAQVRHGFWE